MKKSQIWISAIIYTMVAVITLVIILNTGIPILTDMKEKVVFNKAKEVMLELDRQISEIAAQGEGSQAEVSFEVRDGEIYFYDNQLIWEIETKSQLMSPRTSITQGNLIISSNANVRTFETDNTFIMQTKIKDDTFSVEINKLGSEAFPISFNSSVIIIDITFNVEGMLGDFIFSLNNDPNSVEGIGYIEMIPQGNNTNLGTAKVVAHMDTQFGTYDLEFILQSYADFLIVNVKNFRPK